MLDFYVSLAVLHLRHESLLCGLYIHHTFNLIDIVDLGVDHLHVGSQLDLHVSQFLFLYFGLRLGIEHLGVILDLGVVHTLIGDYRIQFTLLDLLMEHLGVENLVSLVS